MWEETGDVLVTRGSIIMDYGLKLKSLNDGFVSCIQKVTGVNYLWIILMFLSAVWTLFTTEDPL